MRAVATIRMLDAALPSHPTFPRETAMSDAAPEHVHHAIDSIELCAGDLPANRRFYEHAFGWEFVDHDPNYLGIRRPGGGEAGGMTTFGEVRPGGPLVVLDSDDLDATVAAVRDAGGAIAKEPFDFPGGRRFHFRDPSGNELAVWGPPS